MSSEDTPLNEFTKEEWLDVARMLCPDWTYEEFEAHWHEFVAIKNMKGLN